MKKSATTNIPNYCACMAVRKASRAITKLYDQALKPSGLKVTQFSVLMTIKAHGPVNVSALAKLQSLDRTTLVRNLKPLEAAAMIETVTSNDSRERQIGITDQGLQALKIALPRWKTVQTEIANIITAEQLNLLKDLADNLGDDALSEE